MQVLGCNTEVEDSDIGCKTWFLEGSWSRELKGQGYIDIKMVYTIGIDTTMNFDRSQVESGNEPC